MPVRLDVFVLGFALIGLSGCSLPGPRGPELVPAAITSGVDSAKAWVPAYEVTVPPVVTQTPPAIVTIQPARPPTLSAGPIVPKAWFPLESWTETFGFGKPRRNQEGQTTTYEITGTNFILVLTMGKNEAKWNGTEIWLGFAPRLVGGKPQIHGLDVVKNFVPLMQAGRRPIRPGMTIVVDPGHGGDQPGTRSILGNQFEKTYTLDWAMRLKPLLEADGWKVHLTRTNDVDVPLNERVAAAEKIHADLFLSLHFNSSFPSQDQSGLETFTLTPSGMVSTLVRGSEDEASIVLPNNAYDDRNIQWAYRLHRGLLQQVRTQDRGVRRARFMAVLRYQSRPAVLVEGGYLSNPREARLIASPDYRQKLAEGLAAALKPDSTIVTPSPLPVAAPVPVEKPPATNVLPAAEFTR
ncbi:MAG: N-acetylmuramoyl-L-alanine amidase [Opitutaceae bacterium]|nr:N-acetylmuramoyl-L-alanine amidase [Verrucomicrobiales bacterium]